MSWTGSTVTASSPGGRGDDVTRARSGVGARDVEQIEQLTVARHRADLQGLRAVAVLLVVLDHAGVGFLDGGFVGVDVFFVLSGFLITGLLLSEAVEHGSVSLRGFYARRARRILPAASLTLVATCVAAYFLLNVVRARAAVVDSVWASLFGANIHFAHEATDYFARSQPPSPVLHFWSLAVEEQFYLVWPAILGLALFGISVGRRPADGVTMQSVRRLLLIIVAGGVASLLWSVHETAADPTRSYFSPATRAWELALGAALAIGTVELARLPPPVRAAMGWLGLVAIAVAAVTFSDRTQVPGS